MPFTRSSGVLLHPTSLPGRGGIGELGDDAYRWVGFLADAGQRVWQVMPLGPTGYGDSPYQSFSSFAGNPLLISLERLRGAGWLDDADLADLDLPDTHVDYGPVITVRFDRLGRAARAFASRADGEARGGFDAFCARESAWLDDFALFMALKEAHGGASWSDWAAPLRDREVAALAAAAEEHAAAIRRHKLWQHWFYEQWSALKAHANAHGVLVVGDVPIFVAYDSADTWAHRDLFYLDEAGSPTVVAGVPPDYFSATGQRWGNPLYRWSRMAQTGFDWWIRRFESTLDFVDLVRIDHFRGFAGYWEIPADEPTAVEGRWVRGPGQAFFDALKAALGELPILAEDLGVITPDVEALRDRNELPGMKVLQFAFAGGADDPYLPHNYGRNAVVYTGTHDNDTTVGWYAQAPEAERDMVRRYLARGDEKVAWELWRAASSSVADFAIAPLQDLLGLGSEARMNTPGVASGNWSWRFTWDAIPPWLTAELREMAEIYGRTAGVGAADTPYRQSVTETELEEGA
jgi:4-alpha-glucanotransferase